MSIQASQAETRPAPSQFDEYVERQLESTRQQVKVTEVTAGLLTLGLWVFGFLLVGILIDSWLVQFGAVARLVAFGLLAAGALWIIWSKVAVLFLRRIHRLYAAKMIEAGSENFHNSLVNYLQVKEGGQVDREAVVRAISQRAARDLSQISATEKVDRSRAIKLGFVFVGLVGALVAYTVLSPKSPWPSIARILNPVAGISAPTITQIVSVSPGDTDVFFGQKLLISAEVRGRHQPDEVRLVYSTADGQHVDVPVRMLPAGAGSSYQIELSTTPTGIDAPLNYYISANDGRSATFSVGVKPNPAITLEEITVTPPAYTRLPSRTIVGQTEIEGLEGSRVKLQAKANMPIQVAWVELLKQRTRGRETVYDVVRTIELNNPGSPPNQDDSASEASQESSQYASGEFTLGLDANRTNPIYTHYQLLFRTLDGQRNPLVNVQPLRVTADLPPDVKIVRPFDREVAVPLNRSLEIEVQAEDPDFEISRLQLLLDHQGSVLHDEDVNLNENRSQQRITATYRVDPRKLRLSVGDEVIFHARASDNRTAALSGQPDPNLSRTDNYKLRVTEPLETEIADNSPTAADGESGNSGSGQPEDRGAADNQVAGNRQPSGESSGAESAEPSPANSNPADQPAASENQAAGQNAEDNSPAEANQTPTTDNPSTENQGDNSAGKMPPDAQQPSAADQPGSEQQKQPEPPQESSSQEDSGQGDSPSSGQQAGQSTSGSGQQPNQQQGSNSEDAESSPQGKESGETQANPEASEKQPGQDPNGKAGESPAGKQGSSNSNPKQKQPGSGTDQPSANQPEQAGAQPESNSQPAAPENSQESSQDQNSSAQGGGAQSPPQSAAGKQNQTGQGSGESSSGQQNSGEQGAGQSGSDNSTSGSAGESGMSDSSSPENPPAGKQGTSGQENASQSGDSAAGDELNSSSSEPLDKSATDAERFRRLQERLEKEQQQNSSASSPKQGEQAPSGDREQPQPSQAAGEQQPKESQQSATGQSAEGESREPSATNQPTPNQPEPGDSQSAQQPDRQPPQSQPPQGQQPQARQPGGGNSDQPKGGQGDQQSGSGQPGEQASGEKNSGQPGSQNESSQSSEGQPSEQPGSGSQSGDSQQASGGQSSQQSGGQTGQPDQSNENPQSGSSSGQDSQSGKTGGQSGKGGSESGGQPGGQPNTTSGSSGNTTGADQAQAGNSEISRRQDQPQDRRSSSGQANTSTTGVGSNDGPNAAAEDSPGTAEGNLEYSEKATDLVLDHLRNQANNPDPELLKEMNWTEQDLKDFLARWEAMKQKAASGTPQERKRYEDALRSLGLRPEAVRRNLIQARRDQLNRLSEDGAVNRPPANLAEQFNSFLKNRNRVQKDK